jgi:RNA polymerase sigma-70 factor (ECF subfamily)
VQTDLGEELIELMPRLRRFASGLSGSLDRGDELVQAACERLLRHQDRLRPDTRLDSWLYRVIRNLHLDGLRAQAVRDRSAEQIRQTADLRLVGGDRLDEHLQLHEVNQALQQLSEEHRSALMLICVEGLSYREAAEALGVPMGTVTSRLVRARQALMAQMGEKRADYEREASR